MEAYIVSRRSSLTAPYMCNWFKVHQHLPDIALALLEIVLCVGWPSRHFLGGAISGFPIWASWARICCPVCCPPHHHVQEREAPAGVVA